MEWDEYWDFLQDFADLTTSEGLQKLESYLKLKQKHLDMDQADGRGKDPMKSAKTEVSRNNNNDGSASEEDSLDNLSQYFKNLRLSSPESALETPVAMKLDENFFSPAPSSENVAASLVAPHKFGDSTMPNSFAAKPFSEVVYLDNKDCVHNSDVRKDNDFRDNEVYDVDGWESDESCDTYYTAANSPPLHMEMVTPPSSPVFTPVFIAG